MKQPIAILNPSKRLFNSLHNALSPYLTCPYFGNEIKESDCPGFSKCKVCYDSCKNKKSGKEFILRIGDVCDKTREDLLKIKNLGQVHIDELRSLLENVGVKPRHNWSIPSKKKQHIIVEVISGVVRSVYCLTDADVYVLDYDHCLGKEKYFKIKEAEIKKMKKVYQK